jgi:hypothetical protein
MIPLANQHNRQLTTFFFSQAGRAKNWRVVRDRGRRQGLRGGCALKIFYDFFGSFLVKQK